MFNPAVCEDEGMGSQGMAREHTPEIEDYIRQIEAVRADVHRLALDLTDEEIRRRPSDGGWSVLECVAHLTETARQYGPGIRTAVERARAKRQFGTGPFRYGVLQRWLVKSMEPPAKLKVRKTPFPPAAQGSKDEVLAEFDRRHAELIALIRSADGIDLARAKVQSPASRLVRLSAGTAFAAIAAHGRRHVWQARRAAAGRPGPSRP